MLSSLPENHLAKKSIKNKLGAGQMSTPKLFFIFLLGSKKT
jgi:hypothetical protein